MSLRQRLSCRAQFYWTTDYRDTSAVWAQNSTNGSRPSWLHRSSWSQGSAYEALAGLPDEARDESGMTQLDKVVFSRTMGVCPWPESS